MKSLSKIGALGAFVITALLSSCSAGGEGGGEGENQVVNRGSHNSGMDCNSGSCHGSTTGEARQWTIAGTVFNGANSTTGVAGVNVIISSTAGVELFRLKTDASGNFYTMNAVTLPVKASLDSGKAMSSNVSSGSCNSCHSGTTTIY